jgi:hypothetical protein
MLYDKRWDAEVKLEPWQEALLDAAKLIEERGWIKYEYSTSRGFCTVGALREAAADPFTLGRAYSALHEVIGSEDIVTWNDFRAGSKEVIVEALRMAAGVSNPG